MRDQRLRYLRVAFLLSFVAIVSLVNFTHTEKSPWSDARCPACQLQQTIVGSTIAAFVFLPALVMLLLAKARPVPACEFRAVRRLTPRSPPAV